MSEINPITQATQLALAEAKRVATSALEANPSLDRTPKRLNSPTLTVGRSLHFYPAGIPRDAEPLHAVVTKVINNEWCHIAGFRAEGAPFSAQFVEVFTSADPLPPNGDIAVWPPKV